MHVCVRVSAGFRLRLMVCVCVCVCVCLYVSLLLFFFSSLRWSTRMLCLCVYVHAWVRDTVMAVKQRVGLGVLQLISGL